MNKGNLYLIPTVIGDGTQKETLTSPIIKAVQKINVFIVENIRTTRRYIRTIDKEKDIDNITFYCFGKHNNIDLEKDFLPHILRGQDVGIISESGLPCVADPGSKIVAYAHDFDINVIPLVGPSSILLALMASGLNGQKFTFNGYLPIDKSERKKSIRRLEEKISREDQTQIFIETPYRNNQLFEALINTCSKYTKICIATDITTINENIKTKTAIEW
ncbi:SAM-dependent methyltransferase, partial [Flavobacteriales bacterium]|nr:SAM-dependent methyltransferase [Flavobacteriales bacterium]